jgi:maltose O-acetyltransferase
MTRAWKVVHGVLLRGHMILWRSLYATYRHCYAVDPSFRFNGPGIQLYGDGEIVLGADSYIGELSSIQASSGQRVTIGRRCRLSHNLRLYTETSDADSNFLHGDSIPIRGDITIGDGVWIGVNTFIGPGITVGNDSVVGANSVVTKPIPAHEIWGGVPARFIRAKRPSSP